MISENKNINKEYNKLLTLSEIKEKQYEQEHYEEFLLDQTRKLKIGESFNMPKSMNIINRSIDPKLKDKFEDLIEEMNVNTIIPARAKPIIPIKRKQSHIIYPQSHIFTMKIVGKRGSGKTSFLIVFLLSLVNNEIKKNEMFRFLVLLIIISHNDLIQFLSPKT